MVLGGMRVCITQTKYFHMWTLYRRPQQHDTNKELEEMKNFWDVKFKQIAHFKQ